MDSPEKINSNTKKSPRKSNLLGISKKKKKIDIKLGNKSEI